MNHPAKSSASFLIPSKAFNESQAHTPFVRDTLNPLHHSGKLAPSCFSVVLTGRVESAHFPFVSNSLYCRYTFTFGSDWEILHGVNSGITQIATQHLGDCNQGVVWNFPIEISFQSPNIFGWPRIVIAVYGVDMLGRDVVKGYGSVLCPTTPGLHEMHVSMYTPMDNTIWQRFVNWFAGTTPEFYDSKFVAQGKGRAVTLVKGNGKVTIVLNVATKDMEASGYCVRS